MLGANVNFEQFVFPAWKPWTWNSYCFIADSTEKKFKAYLNNLIIHETSYANQHKLTNSITFMNSMSNNMNASGDITNVQIWKRKLSEKGLSYFIIYL